MAAPFQFSNTSTTAWPEHLTVMDIVRAFDQAKAIMKDVITDAIVSLELSDKITRDLLPIHLMQMPDTLSGVPFHVAVSWAEANRLANELRSKGRNPYIFGFDVGAPQPAADPCIVVRGG